MSDLSILGCSAPAQQATGEKYLNPGSFVKFEKAEIEQSIPQRFEKVAAMYPGRIAVKTRTGTVSYAELNQAANRVAWAILARASDGNEPIALLLENDIPMAAAVLGALKAGKIYVPLSPSNPHTRLRYIIGDTEARLILTDDKNFSKARELIQSECKLLNIDELDSTLSPANLGLRISPDSLAYIRYTSGSTGQPKGVMEKHRNLLHVIMRQTNAFQICADDRLIFLGSWGKHIFRGLLNGAALYPTAVKEEGLTHLGQWLIEQEITIYNSIPSVFRHFIDSQPAIETLPRVRMVRLAGEPVTLKDVELFKKHFSPKCILVNELGSTEAGTIAHYIIDKKTHISTNKIPVGYAVEDVKILILDGGKRVGFDEIGEIAVRSRYLSPGYWRRPDLTNAAFLPNSEGGEERIYLTGDLGRMLPDGLLIHLGRKDDQVKIRGYTVGIIETERALLEHPNVKEAAVVPWDDGAGDKYLAAYVVSQKDAAPTVSEMQVFLRNKLPAYMLPSAFVFLKSLPQTNGKVDRRALPRPNRIRPPLAQTYTPPTNELESRLVRIWEEVLDIHPLGIHDNFFDLGGHSLRATQLLAQVRERFGLELPVPFLFESPTIARMAVRIAAPQRHDFHAQEKTEPYSYLVKLQSGGPTNVFCFPYAGGFHGEYIHFAKLAPLIGPDYSFYGLRARGTDGLSKPHRSVREMAGDYINDIQAVQPHGPYFLIGECGGAPEAYETAQQLRSRSETVALLAFLDARGDRRSWDRYLGRWLSAHLRYRRTLLSHSWPREYLKARIAFHLSELQRLRLGQKLLYFFEKTSKVGRVIVDAVHGSGPSVNMTAGHAERQQSDPLRGAQKAYGLARRRYRYRPYDGRITVFVNEEWYRSGGVLGWAKLAAGGLEIHKIPGNHETYLRDHLQLAADILKACLQKAEIQLKLSDSIHPPLAVEITASPPLSFN